MNISIYFLLIIEIVVAHSYKPPNSFCDSIQKFCQDHPYCQEESDKQTYKRYQSRNEKNRKEELEEKGAEVYEYDSFLKEKFVRMANYVRNTVACGDTPLLNFVNDTLPKAAKMPEITWDEELAWLAEIYLYLFDDLPDECRITPSYRSLSFVYENTALFSFEYYSKLWYFLVESFSSFLYLSNIAIQSYQIEDSYLLPPNYILPFIQRVGGVNVSLRNAEYLVTLLNDRVNKMGCASSHYSKIPGRRDVQTVCFFNDRLMVGSPIYETSMVPGSACDRLHPEMQCMCSNEEEEHTTVKPVNIESNTNKPIRPRPYERLNNHHHRRPTCPTIIKIWRPTYTMPTEQPIIIRNAPSVITFCDEDEEDMELSRSPSHIPEITLIYLVILNIWI